MFGQASYVKVNRKLDVDFSFIFSPQRHKDKGEFMNQNYMKEKPILNLIIKMSLPIIISMIINGLYNIVDSFFVSKISENAMTAVSLIFPIQYLANAFGIGFGVAIASLTGFYYGAKEKELASYSATRGVILSLIHGIIITIVSLIIAKPFIKLFTNDPEIIKYGLDYFYIVCFFAPIITVSMALEKILQAQGKMMITMFAMAIGAIVNIVLDPLFILTFNMGVKGAALATGIGLIVGLITYIIIFLKSKLSFNLSLKAKGNSTITKKLYAVGIPSSLNLALPSFMIIALNAILSNYDSSYVLILGVYYKLQTFLYFIISGLVQGIRPLISYNEGAHEYKRVNKIVLYSLFISLLVMVLGTILFVSIPDKLIGIFTNNINTINNGKIALQIISLGFIVSAFQYLISGVFEALSKGLPSLIISLIRSLLIILVAFILSLFFKEKGVWMAFPITETIALLISLILYIIFFKNRNKILLK